MVTNARGIFDRPIAEYVAALVLAMAKDLPRTWDLQRQREWRHRESQRVAGTRACVVGSGPIGRTIVKTLKALEVTTALVGRTARTGIHRPGAQPADGARRLGGLGGAAHRGHVRHVRRAALRNDAALGTLHQRRPGQL